MQFETLQNVPKNDSKSYLRVAAVSSKTALCFFYIGNNEQSLQLLRASFKTGLAVDNFETAKMTLSSKKDHGIDAIILDIPYGGRELRSFCAFLKNMGFESIPIIYNSYHLKNVNLIEYNSIVDDVIDLSNWQFDFYNKITFLKKIKRVYSSLKQKLY